jgi:2-oxoglutarate dehydrogenase E1 component
MSQEFFAMPASATQRLTFLSGVNGEYIAHLYAQYMKNPSSIASSWQDFFRVLSDEEVDVLREQHGASWTPEENRLEANGFGRAFDLDTPPSSALSRPALNVVPMPSRAPASSMEEGQLENTVRLHNLINAYRVYGHCLAQLDPLGLTPPPGHPALEIAHHRLTRDLDKTVFNLMGKLGLQHATLAEVLQKLKTIYGGTSGAEFMHIPDRDRQNWIQKAFENRDTMAVTTTEERKKILKRLADAEGFEQFLHKKFQGAKRFGADGAESLIPALDAIMEVCVADGAEEFAFGMAHRGRLNVLTNVLGKSFTAILAEFQGANALPSQFNTSSDVKYHMGYSNDHDVNGKTVHLSLAYNPSHLEFVNPVVNGKARAKQEQRNDAFGTKVVPILIHGDAAFAGQGVVAESLMMSQLTGYRVGGSVHVIINNQVGFTTRPEDSRSGMYSSDVAKMIDAPVLHVNGDDPEEVVRLARIAAAYRQTFQADVVLDIVCYRRYGHNEGDEPLFTQPVMYKTIAARPPIRVLYTGQLVRTNILTAPEAEAFITDINARMDSAFAASENYKANDADVLQAHWKGITIAPSDNMPRRAQTGIEVKLFDQIGQVLTAIPDGFDVNSKIKRQIETKGEMFKSGMGFDWGTAEGLAFGSLLAEGYGVRLSGQDCRRGTFSHRHAAITSQTNDERFCFLLDGMKDQGTFEVYDSPLSECAVMGFEYGYSLAQPNTLTMWEGQFGDFVNGAQVIMDQFMCSGESKWLRMSGLTLLLPHGFEGQGPEHSSARLERFLQNSAEDNWQVVYPTTPANYFHLLRRQLHRSFRKPLIVMSPKSLLRHKLCVSTAAEMQGQTSFRRILWDAHEDAGKLVKPNAVKRVVLCSGKVYYDLFEAREERGIKDVALVRIEQLYPFPADALAQDLAKYSNADIVWCQEEPHNQGAWSFVAPRIRVVLTQIKHKTKEAVYAGRPEASAPATGLMTRHKMEQAALIDQALKV